MSAGMLGFPWSINLLTDGDMLLKCRGKLPRSLVPHGPLPHLATQSFITPQEFHQVNLDQHLPTRNGKWTSPQELLLEVGRREEQLKLWYLTRSPLLLPKCGDLTNLRLALFFSPFHLLFLVNDLFLLSSSDC